MTELKSGHSASSIGATSSLVKLAYHAEITEIQEVKMEFTAVGYIRFECPTSLPDGESLSVEGVAKEIPFRANDSLFSNAISTQESESNFSIKNRILKGAIGYTSKVGMLINYERFPFDRQILTLDLANNWKKPEFEALESSWFGLIGGLPNTWDTKKPLIGIGNTYNEPCCEFHMPIERKSSFFLRNIVFPLMILSGLGLTSYAFPIADLNARLTVTLTLVLASIAFLYIVNQYIPPVSYFTVIDYYIITNFLLFFISSAESALVYLYQYHESSKAIDTIFAITHSIVFFTASVLIMAGRFFFTESWITVEARRLAAKAKRENSYQYTDIDKGKIQVLGN